MIEGSKHTTGEVVRLEVAGKMEALPTVKHLLGVSWAMMSAKAMAWFWLSDLPRQEWDRQVVQVGTWVYAALFAD